MSAEVASADAETQLRERYRRGGLLGRLTPGKAPAVVVVDLQFGFTEPQYGPGCDLDAVVEATNELLAAARESGVPVVFTTIAFPVDGDGIGGTWLQKMPAMKELREGTRPVEIDSRLGMRDDEHLVVKQTASAFAHTGLAEKLREMGVDSVIITGATTSGCVRATAVDACAADFPAFVVRECVGDREAAPHNASLLDIDAKYGDVIDVQEAIHMVRSVG
ncbi:isochorismatase family protein [Gordonia aurantiaca]|uniref:isochorismatase family protein n=1 Tax=Gordonia sp. B21 TaxID=3151852 RepID=UPI003267E1FA